MNRVALVYHADFLLHSGPPNAFEQPSRVQAIVDVLHEQELMDKITMIEPDEATTDELVAGGHTIEHIEAIDGKWKEGEWEFINDRNEGPLKDDSTYICSDSAHVARLSAGSVIAAVKLVANEEYQHAITLNRPPGHHASSDVAHGFCIYNNTAVGVAAARSAGYKKVAVVDWDVHHGDGTESLLKGDRDTLYISTHRHDCGKFFPYTGSVSKDDETLNIPLPCTGCGDDEFKSIFSQLIMPRLVKFSPDLVIISAGFDIMEGDYVGRMSVSPLGVFSMTNMLMTLSVPLIAVLEGGYNQTATSYGVAGCIRALLGAKDASQCEDPYEGAGQMKSIAQQARIASAVEEMINSMSI